MTHNFGQPRPSKAARRNGSGVAPTLDTKRGHEALKETLTIMRRRSFLTLLAPLALAACADNAVGPGAHSGDDHIPPSELPALGDPSQEELARFAKSNNAFAFDLYRQVAGAEPNLALSPFSLSTALTMTWAGAKTETETEMRSVLHLDGPRERVLTDAGKVNAWVQGAGQTRPFELKGVNRLFGEQTTTFETPFLNDTKRAFGAPLAPMDFKNAADTARGAINGWVEEHTNKRIKELIPGGALDASTRLVLVNAVYFLAEWATPFEKHATYGASFSTAAGDKQVETMHAMDNFQLAEGDGVKALELAYKGDSLSMVLVLPNAKDGLATLERTLTPERLAGLRASMKSTLVRVSLPKFEIDPAQALGLGGALKQLGMPLAFEAGRADFTGIAKPASKAEELYISEVFHKAFVKVDEKGTEAAAASAVVMAEAGAAIVANVEFTADHPFLFFIVDRQSGTILFMGRVADPASKQGV